MFRSLYLDRRTVVHRLDPRTKIIAFALVSVDLFAFNDPVYVGAIALALIAIGALARSLENYIRVWHLLIIFLIVPAVVWLFFLESAEANGLAPPAAVSSQSVAYGIGAGIRYSSVLMLGTLFGSTVAIEELLLGLVRLGVPYRVAFLFTLAARLVPTFASVLSTIVEAQVSRGLDLETRNPFRRVRNFVPVILPFFVYAVRYSSVLSMAMETRGFSLAAERSYLREPRLTRVDYLTLAALLAGTAGAVTLRLLGYGAVIPGRL